jgi:ribosome-binding factor A
VINLLNKNYSRLVKKELAGSKKFSHIPSLVFLPDKELETMHSLEKILKKTSPNHD